MHPGLYVARVPDRRSPASRETFIIESRCFSFEKVGAVKGLTREWVERSADNWRDWIQSQHPKDDVFVIEVKEPVDEAAS